MQEIIREWETSMSMKEKLSFNKMGNYYEVEMETIKRKYDVDIQKLMECLNQHRTIKLSEIAERLNRPKTMVEHWFRKDKCFAIPDADIWMELKALLGIETTEFDESIMTFVTDGSKYDMSGRIYTGDTSPTITTDCANNLYMLKPNKFIDEKNVVAIESHPKDSRYHIVSPETNQTIPSIMCHDAAHGGLIMEQIKKQTVYDWHRQDTRMTECGDVCVTAAAGWGGGGNNMPYVLEEKMITQGINGETAGTLDSNYYKGCGERQGIEREVVVMSDTAACLDAAMGYKGVHSQMQDNPQENFVINREPKCIGNGQTAQLDLSEKVGCLNCMHEQQAILEDLMVRRLTPTECALLQGFPSDWMDIGEWVDSKGKKHNDSDAPKYKAAGNSIALPFWQWLAIRIRKELGLCCRARPDR